MRLCNTQQHSVSDKRKYPEIFKNFYRWCALKEMHCYPDAEAKGNNVGGTAATTAV